MKIIVEMKSEKQRGNNVAEYAQLAKASNYPQEDFEMVVYVISMDGQPLMPTTPCKARILRKRCVPKGDYQQTKGVRSEMRIPTGKVQGFKKFDKVEYEGVEYFIQGRMSSGYVVFMDLCGNKAQLKPMPKFSKMERLQARSGWMMTEDAFIPHLRCA